MGELRPKPQPIALGMVCQALRVPSKPGDVSGLTLDSRQVQRGDLYAALPGEHTHGANFAAQAIAHGATAIVTDLQGAHLIGDVDVPVIVVPYPRETLGLLAKRIYGGARPRLVGVTGTNGKTTTTHFVEAVLSAAGNPTAVIGTLGVRFGDLHDYSGRTTPEAPALHAALQALAEAGAAFTAMEVSSHALALHRVDGLRFDVAVFTGLSQDHLDFHRTMEDYFAAKARLFEPQNSAASVINIDDAWGEQLAGMTVTEHVTYAVAREADWTARGMTARADGSTAFVAVGPGIELPITVALPGRFNVANALAALAAAQLAGIDLAHAADGLAAVRVPGRFEAIRNPQGIAAFVDYAHTPDAVSRVLEVARAAVPGRVIAVLGCGGDRDPHKRPLMGAAAAERADVVIVTDDNPRSEDPALIRAAVIAGAGSVTVEEVADRASAIRRAVELAEPGDCIMVLGKGHETGQEVAGVIHPFDDREVMAAAFGERT